MPLLQQQRSLSGKLQLVQSWSRWPFSGQRILTRHRRQETATLSTYSKLSTQWTGKAPLLTRTRPSNTVHKRHGKYANTKMHTAGHTAHEESRSNRRMGLSKGRSVHLRSQFSDPFHLLVQPGSGHTCQLQYIANQGFDSFQHALEMVEPEKAVCKGVWFECHIE
jgi:hypothetical protein